MHSSDVRKYFDGVLIYIYIVIHKDSRKHFPVLLYGAWSHSNYIYIYMCCPDFYNGIYAAECKAVASCCTDTGKQNNTKTQLSRGVDIFREKFICASPVVAVADDVFALGTC